MAQWAALVTKPNRAVQLYHNNNFPLDVRHHLSGKSLHDPSHLALNTV